MQSPTMPSKPATPDAPPLPTWRHATATLAIVTASNARIGAGGLWQRWRSDPSGHAATALVTVLLLAVMVLANVALSGAAAADDPAAAQATAGARLYGAIATQQAPGEVDTPEPTRQGMAPSWGAGLPASVTRWASIIEAAADKHGLEPRLLACMMSQESGGQPAVPSPAGAVGLLQLMPATARELGLTVVSGGQDDRLDPAKNVDAGAKYMAQHLATYGDLATALVAYNGGGGAVAPYRAGRPYTESRNYIAAILPCLERGA